MTNTPIASGIVWFCDVPYFISTIDRDCSSMVGGRYSETIIWEWDKEKRERGDILHMESGSQACIKTHLWTCEKVFNEGKYWEKTDD